jgi:hypothetical protein
VVTSVRDSDSTPFQRVSFSIGWPKLHPSTHANGPDKTDDYETCAFDFVHTLPVSERFQTQPQRLSQSI